MLTINFVGNFPTISISRFRRADDAVVAHVVSTSRRARSGGFTLVELMIVVAVVAILAAVALPSYQSHVRKSNRAVAQKYMMEVANMQERYFLDTRSYASSLATLSSAAPSDVSRNYTVSTTAGGGAPPTYTITATPLSGSSQAPDGSLTLTSTGQKLPADKW